MEFDPLMEANAGWERFTRATTEAIFMLGQSARRELEIYMNSIPVGYLPTITLPGNEFKDNDHQFLGYLVDYEVRQVGDNFHKRHVVITPQYLIIANSLVHPDETVTDGRWDYLYLKNMAPLTVEQALQWAIYGRTALFNLAGRCL